MKSHFKNLKVSICLILVTFASSASAESPIWKVSKGDSHLYLGGTIHLLSQKDYPLPQAFDLAYKDSEEVVFETDIAAMSSPETQGLMQKVVISPAGTTLKNTLSEETYSLLVEFLGARQIPVEAVNQVTPAGLSLTLTVMELQRMGLSPAAGVDQYYNLRSIDDGKEIEELETVEEQISFIESLNSIDPDVLITHTISEIGKMDNTFPALLNAWRTGDLQELEAQGIKPMKEFSQEMYKVFLVDRNNKWMEEIDAMMNDDNIEFVLVGALHMAGEHGLIKQLKAADYEVVQLD